VVRDKKTDLTRNSLGLRPSNDNQRFRYSEKCGDTKTRDDKTSTFLNTTLRKAAYGNAMRNHFIQRRSFIGLLLSRTVFSSPLQVIARDVEAEVMWCLNIFSPAMDYGQQDSDAISHLTRSIETLCLFLWYCTPRDHSSK
jgi:hypothetical protein